MQQDNRLQTGEAEAGEQVSALADGELHGAACLGALEFLRQDPRARADWHDYHLIGDLMREGACAAVGVRDETLVLRLRERLAREHPQPSPDRTSEQPASRTGANDAVWRWKLVAGLSALAVAAVFGWQVLAQWPPGEAAPQLAAATPGGVPEMPAVPVMIRDPRLDQWIAAHQQQGGTSALQMPAGFLRNATFERPAR